MARAVPIVEVRDHSSFFTENIGMERSANSGHRENFGRKPRSTFLEKTAALVRCHTNVGSGEVG